MTSTRDDTTPSTAAQRDYLSGPPPRPATPLQYVSDQFGSLARQFTAHVRGAGPAGDLARAVAAASVHARQELRAAAQVADDGTRYPEGRREQIARAASRLDDDLDDRIDAVKILMHVVREDLISRALPHLPASQEVTARADAQMLLDKVPAQGLPLAMAGRAQNNDPIAALLASDWGRLYLESRGYSDPVDGHHLVRIQAARSAAGSGNSYREGALADLDSLADIAKGVVALQSTRRHARDDMTRIRDSVVNPAAAERDMLRRQLQSEREAAARARAAARNTR